MRRCTAPDLKTLELLRHCLSFYSFSLTIDTHDPAKQACMVRHSVWLTRHIVTQPKCHCTSLSRSVPKAMFNLHTLRGCQQDSGLTCCGNIRPTYGQYAGLCTWYRLAVISFAATDQVQIRFQFAAACVAISINMDVDSLYFASVHRSRLFWSYQCL